MIRSLVGLSLVLILFCVSGCSSTYIRGRVIEGPVNVTTLVTPVDPRLAKEAEGVPEAEVIIMARGMSMPKVIRTEKDGTFEVKAPRRVDVTGSLELRAEAEGFRREQSSVPFPPETSRLLIVLPKR